MYELVEIAHVPQFKISINMWWMCACVRACVCTSVCVCIFLESFQNEIEECGMKESYMSHTYLVMIHLYINAQANFH